MAHLTYSERQTLEDLYNSQRFSLRKIAEKMQKHHRVIQEEIKRNTGQITLYIARRAQEQYEKRLCGKRVGKLEQYPFLKAYVLHKLTTDEWSPDSIAGHLKSNKEHMGISVSHETIYQYIYSKEGKELGLYKYLHYKHRKRRPKHGRKSRNTIPERVSIHQREGSVEQRITLGNWESDLIQFSKQPECVSVEYERKSRYTFLSKVMNKTAAEKVRAWMQLIDAIPNCLIRTMTCDNGSENVQHMVLHDWEIETYFCDPYASWQKGGVENENHWLRRYLPRDTCMADLTDEELQKIQTRINNKPRKSLNYLTPHQVLLGGAFNP